MSPRRLCLITCISLSVSGCSRYEPLPPTDAGFNVLEPDSVQPDSVGDSVSTADASVLDVSTVTEDSGPEDGGLVSTDGGTDSEVANDVMSDAPVEPDSGHDDVLDSGHDDVLDGAVNDAQEGDADGDSVDAEQETVEDVSDSETSPDTAPGCEDLCDSAGSFRCHPEDAMVLQVCEEDPSRPGDCLVWGEYATCTVEDLCSGAPLCLDGACTVDTSAAVECPASANPCQPLVCEPTTGQCETNPVPEGGGCDDLDPCTVLDKCTADGQCTGLPNTAQCGCASDEDCLELDDGNACNGRYRCEDAPSGSAKFCQYDPQPTVCDADPTGCNTMDCDPETEQCLPTPVEDGVSCDDGQACTLSASCLGGACVAQTEVSCEPGLCETAFCDVDTGQCVTEPLTDCCGNGVEEGDEQCEPGGQTPCTAECAFESCAARALEFSEGCVFLPVTGAPLTTTQSLRVEFFASLASGLGTMLDFPGEDSDAGWRVDVNEVDGTRRYQWIELQPGGMEQVVNGPEVPQQQWHHVTVTRLPDLGQVHLQWFINGVVSADAKYTGTARTVGGGDGAWLGCKQGGPALHGRVDEVRIGVDAVSAATVPQGPLVSTAADLLHYHFDDLRPGIAVDATGNEFHGLWNGVLASTDQPMVGADGACSEVWCERQGLYFESSAEAGVSAAANPLAQGIQSMTVEFYLRIDATDAGQVVLGFDDGSPGNPDWHISVVPFVGQSVRLQWNEGQLPGIDNAISSPPLTTGVVYHIAVEREVEEPGSGTLTWYINGLKDATKSLDLASNLAWEERTMWIGSDRGVSGFFTGWFDELKISEGVQYGGDFDKPTTLSARWDTYALYHFDSGAGWVYNVAPTSAQPIVVEGATPTVDFTSPVAGCP